MKKKEIVLMRREIPFSCHSPTYLLTIIQIIFRHGVGNPVPTRSDVAGGTQSLGGTQVSGWTETQREDGDDVDPNSPEEGADLSLSEGSISQTGPTPSANRPDQPAQSPNGPSSLPNTSLSNPPVQTPPNNLFAHRSHSQQPSTRSSSIAGTSRRTSNSQGGIQASLAAYFDPEARRTREMESSMSQFYVARLQEATTTINRLQDEVTRLRDGINIQVLRLQDELKQAHKELANKNSENQSLQHQIDLLQLRMEFASHATPGNSGYMRNPSFGNWESQNPNSQGSSAHRD